MDNKNEYRVLLAEAERLLANSTNDAIRDRVELRDAVCGHLESERTKGVPLSAILDSVEEILVRAESRSGHVDGHQKFVEQIIDWCLEFYRQGTPEVS